MSCPTTATATRRSSCESAVWPFWASRTLGWSLSCAIVPGRWPSSSGTCWEAPASAWASASAYPRRAASVSVPLRAVERSIGAASCTSPSPWPSPLRPLLSTIRVSPLISVGTRGHDQGSGVNRVEARRTVLSIKRALRFEALIREVRVASEWGRRLTFGSLPAATFIPVACVMRDC